MSTESALALIESVKDYRVLFVGDAITDEYHYVQPLGKSAKEHLIPLRYVSREVFKGGVIAAANHARSFCKTVDVWHPAKVVRKVRFVDDNQLRKLAEVHYEEEIFAVTHFNPDQYDVVVLADFGHGGLKKDMLDSIMGKAKFLAVSTQTNSSNIGFNLITKYARADYMVVDEPEARLAAADRESPIAEVMAALSQGRCGKLIVTHGRNGSYGLDNGRFIHHKSRTDLVRDTMGAGDAFFAVTATMAKTGSIEDLLAIGNAAGAVKCGIVGHRAAVTKEAVIVYLKADR